MALWMQYSLLIFGLSVVAAFARMDAEKGNASAGMVYLVCALGMIALSFHAITGGA